MRSELVPQLIWCFSRVCISASMSPSEWRSGERRLSSGLSSKQDKHCASKCLMVPFYEMGKPFFFNVCQILGVS